MAEISKKKKGKGNKLAELSEKHQAFVYHYIELQNGTESYKKAYGVENDGSAAVSASRLLKNEKIADAIQEGIEKLLNPQIASAQEVLEFLTGKMTDLEASDASRLKAAEMLGRRHRLFVEKVETTSTNFKINIIGLEAEEEENPYEVFESDDFEVVDNKTEED